MNILAIADEPSKSLWDYYEKDRLKGVDLILSCGDLPSAYLSFLATMHTAPVLYVHGNHDRDYAVKPPEGCECIEDRIFVYKGIRFLGLGGSYFYNNPLHQYTEAQMKKRIARLRLSLLKNRGFDVLLTHAPARGLGDGEDQAHRGFECFLPLLEKYQPSFMVHGHMHLNYSYKLKREQTYQETRIINAYEKTFFQIP